MNLFGCIGMAVDAFETHVLKMECMVEGNRLLNCGRSPSQRTPDSRHTDGHAKNNEHNENASHFNRAFRKAFYDSTRYFNG